MVLGTGLAIATGNMVTVPPFVQNHPKSCVFSVFPMPFTCVLNLPSLKRLANGKGAWLAVSPWLILDTMQQPIKRCAV